MREFAQTYVSKKLQNLYETSFPCLHCTCVCIELNNLVRAGRDSCRDDDANPCAILDSFTDSDHIAD